MASLIAPLASGINGASSGTAEIYQRGTTSVATAYADKDLQTAMTSHPLDANGGVVRYVSQSVDVICKDSTGVVVRQFTWEDYAASVEVRNAGFTGTLTNGSQGAGGRTTLDTVLSSLYSSFGGLDGKINVGGSGQNAKDLLANTSAIVYNVTSTAYGAIGNDINDDTSAIQAAINAAVTAGGGIIYFPSGTYKLSSALSVSSAKIQFLGITPSASILKQYTASTAAVTVSGADFCCENIGFTNGISTAKCLVTSAATGRYISCSFTPGTTGTGITLNAGATETRFIGCELTIGAGGTGVSLASAAPNVSGAFIGCSFNQNGATGSLFSFAGTADLLVQGGRVFIPTASSAAITSGSSGRAAFAGVTFFYSAGAGSMSLFSGLTSVVSGCNFVVTAGGTLTVNARYESGSSGLDNANTVNSTSNGISSSRSQLVKFTSTAGSSYTPDASVACVHIVSSSGAAMAFNAPTVFAGLASFISGLLIICFENTNAGSVTPTFNAVYKMSAAPACASNSGATFIFVLDPNNSTWRQVGGAAAAYAT